MRSLRSRLTTGLLASLIAMFALQLLAVAIGLPRILETTIGQELSEDADELFATLRGHADAKPERFTPNSAFAVHHADYFYEVWADNVKLHASPTLAGTSLTLPSTSGPSLARQRTAGLNSHELIVLTKNFDDQNQKLTIAMGVDARRLDAHVRSVLWAYGSISLLALACLILLQSWMINNAFSILKRTGSELTNLRRGTAQSVNEQVPEEIFPLVHEVNQLSSAMKQRLQRSREALANLAHRIKTPLTVLGQLASGADMRDRPNLTRSMMQQIEMMHYRVDLELKRARLAGRGGLTQAVDMCAELRTVVQTMMLLYRGKQLEVQCLGPNHMHFSGDREDMLELFGNLLDNAAKYGRQCVQVEVTEQPSGLTLTFQDDGPGCDPEQFSLMTARGVRFDEQQQGHGLGLAIAMEIVASYGGSLDFSRSATLGGLCVKVWLPRSPQSD